MPVAPTLPPTDPPLLTIGATFDDVTLRLVGISSMNETAQNNFESALQGWYASLYEQDLRRRFLQQQQQQRESSLPQFQTRVLYKNQAATENDNVVTYDQNLSFVQPANQEVGDLRRILLDPFDNPDLVRQLLVRLRASDAFFEALDEDAVEAPVVPQPRVTIDGNSGGGGGGGDDDSNLGLILGIVAAGLVVLAVVMFLLLRPTNKRGETPTAAAEPVKRVA